MSDFITYLQKKDYTQSTQDTYLQTVNRFMQWYKSEVINTEKKDILKNLEYLKTSKKQSNHSRNCELISLNPT